MTTRASALTAGVLGALWAFGVVWIGVEVITLPVFSFAPTVLVAFLGPGLTLAALILWDGLRRSAGGTEAGGPARRAIVDQVVLALCLWPAAGFLAGEDGPGILVALCVFFPLSALAFCIGSAVSPFLRVLGGSATFCATVFALVWAVAVWLI